jgi:hypothetical protein
MALENLLASGMVSQAREVMALERFEEMENDRLVVFCRHANSQGSD